MVRDVPKKFLFYIVFSASLVFASGLSFADGSSELEPIWEKDWQPRADKLVEYMAGSFVKRLEHALDTNSHKVATNEFRFVFQSIIGWEAFSDTVVESMRAECGSYILNELAPYLVVEVKQLDPPEDLLQQYSICQDNALRQAEMVAVYAIAADNDEIKKIFSKYEAAFASYQRISPKVTTARVEQKYGGLLDEVAAFHSISQQNLADQQTDILTARFLDDPAVLMVSLKYVPQTMPRKAFYYVRDKAPQSKSCSGISPPEQKGLTRCSWGDIYDIEENVLRYTRAFEWEGERSDISIEFDYSKLLKAFK